MGHRSLNTFLLVLVALPFGATAATITVNTKLDTIAGGDGYCTLREAVANVNAAADTTGGDCAAGTGSGDTITFSLPLPATIALTLGQLGVGQDLTIAGPPTGRLRIDGRTTTRIFEITAGTVSMSDLTLTRGYAESGGAISVAAGSAATFTNCTFTYNRSSLQSGGGGAIDVGGTATLSNCTLSRNRALSDGLGDHGQGGAIRVAPGATATLTNCTLSRNTSVDGGAIRILGTATLTDCTLSANTSDYEGGGLSVGAYFPPPPIEGTATLTNCTLSRNKASEGGGISVVSGTATLSNCTLQQNRAERGGGGVSNLFGTTTFTSCTLSRNRAGGWGGGLSNYYGTAMLTNCTLSRNVAIRLRGGGLDNNPGTVMLTNCTLSGNRASVDSGLASSGTTTVTNTIVASGSNHNCTQGAILSGGHNLSSDDTCFAGGGSDLLDTPPRLAPLGNYGGPTQTLALCTGPRSPARACTAASPAIDAADDAITGPPDNLTTDQRGLPRLAGAHVDIGAYEAQ